MSKSKATRRLAILRQNHAGNITDCRKGISKFCAELKDDPYNAFRWAQGPVSYSASMRVSQKIVALIDTLPRGSAENAMTPAERLIKIGEVVTHEALSAARCVPSSSSGVSNVAEQHLVAAWADAARDLEWAVAFGTEE